MSDTFLAIIKDSLAEVLERPVDTVTTDMRLDADFDLDSVMFVQFLLALEDRVPNLQFDPEVISEAGFNDIGELTAFLKKATSEAA